MKAFKRKIASLLIVAMLLNNGYLTYSEEISGAINSQVEALREETTKDYRTNDEVNDAGSVLTEPGQAPISDDSDNFDVEENIESENGNNVDDENNFVNNDENIISSESEIEEESETSESEEETTYDEEPEEDIVETTKEDEDENEVDEEDNEEDNEEETGEELEEDIEENENVEDIPVLDEDNEEDIVSLDEENEEETEEDISSLDEEDEDNEEETGEELEEDIEKNENVEDILALDEENEEETLPSDERNEGITEEETEDEENNEEETTTITSLDDESIENESEESVISTTEGISQEESVEEIIDDETTSVEDINSHDNISTQSDIDEEIVEEETVISDNEENIATESEIENEETKEEIIDEIVSTNSEIENVIDINVSTESEIETEEDIDNISTQSEITINDNVEEEVATISEIDEDEEENNEEEEIISTESEIENSNEVVSEISTQSEINEEEIVATESEIEDSDEFILPATPSFVMDGLPTLLGLGYTSKVYWWDTTEDEQRILHLSSVRPLAQEYLDGHGGDDYVNDSPYRGDFHIIKIENKIRMMSYENFFRDCSSATEIKNMKYIDTAGSTNFSCMFKDCYELRVLYLQDMVVQDGSICEWMFDYCYNLNRIYVSDKFSTNLNPEMPMFSGVDNLSGGAGTTYNTIGLRYDCGMEVQDPMSAVYARVDEGVLSDKPGFFTRYYEDSQVYWYLKPADEYEQYNLYLEGTKPTDPAYESQLNNSNRTDDYSQFFLSGENYEGMIINGGIKGDDIAWRIKNVYIKSTIRPSTLINYFSRFDNCVQIVGLEKIDMSNRGKYAMDYMFARMNTYRDDSNVVISVNFDTSNCVSLRATFDSFCGSLDLTKMNTSNVVSMEETFESFKPKNEPVLNLKNFDTRKVRDMKFMFYYDTDLRHIFVGNNFNVDNVVSSIHMFTNCYQLEGGLGTAYDDNKTDKTWARLDLRPLGDDYRGYFTEAPIYWYYDNVNKILHLSADKNEEFLNTAHEYRGENYRTPGDINGEARGEAVEIVIETPIKRTSYNEFFVGLENVRKITNTEYIDTSDAIELRAMFGGCRKLDLLFLQNFDVSKVLDANYMFDECNLLRAIYVSEDFNFTSLLGEMSMFSGCNNLMSASGVRCVDCGSGKESSIHAHITGAGYNGADVGYFTKFVSKTYWNIVYAGGFHLHLSSEKPSEKFVDTYYNDPYMMSGEDFIGFERWFSVYGQFDEIRSGLVEICIDNEIQINSAIGLFKAMSNVNSLVGIEKLDISHVEDISEMFMGIGVASLNLNTFDTSHIKAMDRLFYGSNNLQLISATSDFNLTSLIAGRDEEMFYACTSLNGYNSSKVNSNYAKIRVGSNGGYFIGTEEDRIVYTIKELDDGKAMILTNSLPDLSGNVLRYDFYQNASYSLYGEELNSIRYVEIKEKIKPASLDGYFAGLKKVVEIIGLENIDSTDVINFTGMFRGCEELRVVDLSSLDMQNVQSVEVMFQECKKLNTIYVDDDFDISAPEISKIGIFGGATSLVGGAGTTYTDFGENKIYARIDKGNDTERGYFTEFRSKTYWYFIEDMSTGECELRLSGTKPTSNYYLQQTINSGFGAGYRYRAGDYYTGWLNIEPIVENINRAQIKKVIIENEIKPSSLYNFFADLGEVREIVGLENINMDGAPIYSCQGAFEALTRYSKRMYLNFDTTNCINMVRMFGGLYCEVIDGYGTDNSEDKYLTTLSLGEKFKNNKVESMERMFLECQAYKIDVSNLGTSECINMDNMFENCRLIMGLDLTNFDTSNVVNMNGMISSCERLVQIAASDKFSVKPGSDVICNCYSVMGEKGTKYDNYGSVPEFNRIDEYDQPGYFSKELNIYTYWYFVPYDEYSDQGILYLSGTEPNNDLYNNAAPDQKGCNWHGTDYEFFNGLPFRTEEIETVVIDNEINRITYEGFFEEFHELLTIENMQNIKTDNAVNLAHMFYGCNNIPMIDLSSFNTERVKHMGGMFGYCWGLTTLYSNSDFNIDHVEVGEELFYDCTNLVGGNGTHYNNGDNIEKTKVDGRNGVPGLFTGKILNWYVHQNDHSTMYISYIIPEGDGIISGSYVNTDWSYTEEDMYNKGIYKYEVKRIVIPEEIKAANYEDFFASFPEMQHIEGMENINTSEAENFAHMFFRCSQLHNIDVSHFVFNKPQIDLSYMFAECENLEYLDLMNFELLGKNYVSYYWMFGGCSNLRTIKGNDKFVASNNDGGDEMFSYCDALRGGEGSDIGRAGTNIGAARPDKFYTSSQPGLFSGTSTYWYVDDKNDEDDGLTTLHLLSVFPEDSPIFQQPFGNASARGYNYKIDFFVDRADIEKVVIETEIAESDYSNYFRDFSNLKEIKGIENINLGNAHMLDNMFRQCTSLKGLDLSTFDTSNIESMACMFEGCINLFYVDIKNFNTEKVMTFDRMFAGCGRLNCIAVGDKFIVKPGAVLDYMFYDTYNLVGGKGTEWGAHSFSDESMYRAFALKIDGGISNPGLLSREIPYTYWYNKNNVLYLSSTEPYTTDFLDNPHGDFYIGGLAEVGIEYVTKIVITNKIKSPIYYSYFRDAVALTEIEGINNIDTSNAQSLSAMFLHTQSLNKLDITSFDLTNATNISSMIADSGVSEIYFGNHNVRNANDISGFINDCPNLTTIYATDKFYNTLSDDVKSAFYDQVFFNCPELVGGEGFHFCDTVIELARVDKSMSGGMPGYFTYMAPTIEVKFNTDGGSEIPKQIIPFNTKAVEPAAPVKEGYVFIGYYTEPTFENLYDFDEVVTEDLTLYCRYMSRDEGFWWTSKPDGTISDTLTENTVLHLTRDIKEIVSEKSGMFTFGALAEDNFSTSVVGRVKKIVFDSEFKPTTTEYLFLNCAVETIENIDKLDTSDVTTMQLMFGECRSLTEIDLSSFNTEKVESMKGMFTACRELTSLDLSSFNTSNVTQMGFMFETSDSLVNINLSSFDTSNVESMDSMFYGCTSLKELDLTSFNFANTTAVMTMFKDCSELEKIYVTSGYTSAIVLGSGVFDGDIKLVGGNGTRYDSTKITSDYGKIDTTTAVGYFIKKSESHKITKETKYNNVVDNTKGTFIVNRGGTYSTNYTNGIERVVNQQAVNITITPATNYTVDTVKVISTKTDGTTQTQNATAPSNMTTATLVYTYTVPNNLKIDTEIKYEVTFKDSYYAISTVSTSHGAVNVVDKALPGETVTVTMVPDTGFEINTVTAYKTGAESTTVTLDTTADVNVRTFTMPDYPVTIKATFKLTRNAGYWWTSKPDGTVSATIADNTVLHLTKDEQAIVTSKSGIFTFGETAKNNFTQNVINTITKVKFESEFSPTTTISLFQEMKLITAIENLNKLDTSDVTNMGLMFSDCDVLETLDLSSFDTRKVTNMQGMFNNCKGLKNVNLSSFETPALTGTAMMFGNCIELTSLDLSTFTFNLNTKPMQMFSGCTKLQEIFVSEDFLELTGGNSRSLFRMTGKIIGGNGTEAPYSTSTAEGSETSVVFAKKDTLTTVGYFIDKETSHKIVKETKYNDAVDNTKGTFTVNRTGTNPTNYVNGVKRAVIGQEEKIVVSPGADYKVATVKIISTKADNTTQTEDATPLDITAASPSYTYTIPSNLKEGTDIKFEVTFRDKYFTISTESTTHGTFTVPNRAMPEETVTINIAPNEGYEIDLAKVYKTGDESTVILESTISEATKTFTMPEYDVTVKITFKLNRNYGFWWTSKPDGTISDVIAENTVIHLTTDEQEIVSNKSGKFIFGEKITTYGASSLRTIIENVIFESEFKPTTTKDLFGLCAKIVNINNLDKLDTSDVTTMDGMFNSCINLESLDLTTFNTSSLTSVERMFTACRKLETIDISSFDLSQITNMTAFFNQSGVTSIVWPAIINTSNVTTMHSMFYNCQALNSFDFLNQFDTSNVTTMQRMFNNCKVATKLDLSSFTFKDGVDVTDMFNGCIALKEIDVTNDLPASAVGTDVFLDSVKLVGGNGTKYDSTKVALENAKKDTLTQEGYFTDKTKSHNITKKTKYNDTEDNTKGSFIINRTGSLATTYTDGVTKAEEGQAEEIVITATSSVYYVDSIKVKTTKSDNTVQIESLATPTDINVNPVIDPYTIPSGLKVGSDIEIEVTFTKDRNKGFWYVTDASGNRGIANESTYNVLHLTTEDQVEIANQQGIFTFGKEPSANFGGVVVSKVKTIKLEDEFSPTKCKDLFMGFGKVTNIIDINKLDTSEVISMEEMFMSCGELLSLDISSFNMQNVQSANLMFAMCSKLATLNLPTIPLNTGKIEIITGMFAYCEDLTVIDLSNFDISKVKDAMALFGNCTNLTTVTMPAVETPELQNLSTAFALCPNLETIIWTTLDTSAVTDMSFMFRESVKLESSDMNFLTLFNTQSVETMEGMFEGCVGITKLDLSSFTFKDGVDITNMFKGCSVLKEIDVTNELPVSATGTDVFLDSVKLVGGNGTKFDSTKVALENAKKDTTTQIGYFTDKTKSHNIIKKTKFNDVEDDTKGTFIVNRAGAVETTYTEGITKAVEGQEEKIFVTATSSVYTVEAVEITTTKSDNTTQMEYAMLTGSEDVTPIEFSYTIPTGLKEGSDIEIVVKLKMHRNKGFWYVADNDGNVGVANSSTYNTLHLTTNYMPTVEDQSGTFVFGDDIAPVNFGSTVAGNVTKVIIDSEFKPDTLKFAFREMSKITAIENLDKIDTSNMISMLSAFSNCPELVSLDISSFDLSSVYTMAGMFGSCSKLENITFPANMDNTTSLTHVTSMFSGCHKLSSINMPNINTSSVNSMYYMFTDCYELTNLDLSTFDTSNVTDMRGMFAGCKKLTKLDLTAFVFKDSVNVTEMFCNCSELKEIDVTNDLPATAVGSDVFVDSIKLVGGNGTKYDSTKVSLENAKKDTLTQEGYFTDKSKSHSITKKTKYNDVEDNTKGSFIINRTGSLATTYTDGVTKAEEGQEEEIVITATSSVYQVKSVKVKTIKSDNTVQIQDATTPSDTTANPITYTYTMPTGLKEGSDIEIEVTFERNPNKGYWYITDASGNRGAADITTYNIYHITTDEQPIVSNQSGIFTFGTAMSNYSGGIAPNVAKVVIESEFKPTLMESLFINLTNLTEIENLDKINTSNAIKMNGIFAMCSELTSIDISSFDTSNATAVFGMFGLCSKLESITFPTSMNIANATSMENMFYECSKLTSLDLTVFNNTEALTTMGNMFIGCSELTSVNLSTFNTSNVTNMQGMFEGCEKLENIDLTTFTFNAALNTSNMFKGCSILKDIYVTNDFPASATGTDVFLDAVKLVGGNGTKFDSTKVALENAKKDTLTQEGYFTDKTKSHNIIKKTKYNDVEDNTKGTFIVNRTGSLATTYTDGVTKAEEGQTEKIVVSPVSIEYAVDTVKIIATKSDGTTLTQDATPLDITAASPSYTYTIPTDLQIESNIIFEVTFKDAYYPISTESTIHGSFTVVEKALPSDTVTISNIVSDIGFELDEVKVYKTGDESTVITTTGTGSSRTFTMPTYPVTVRVIFKPIVYNITKVTPENGDFTVPTTATMSEVITISNILGNTGFEIDEVTVTKTTGIGAPEDVVVSGDGDTRTFTMPAGDVEVKVTYKPIIYTITKITSSKGTFTVQNTATYSQIVHITGIAANAGYDINEVLVKDVDGNNITVNPVSDTEKTFTMPNKNVTVEVTYVDHIYNITQVAQPSAGGTIACDATATMSTIKHITITASAGYQLTNVVVKRNDTSANVSTTVVTAGTEYTFVMPTSDVTITATFTPINYTITKAPFTGGSYNAPTVATMGQIINITNITANLGYELSNVVVTKADGSDVTVSGTGDSRTFTMPDSNVTITVTFNAIDYTITVNPSADGTGTTSLSTANINQVVTLTVTPNAADKIVQTIVVAKDGDPTTTVPLTNIGINLYRFTMPAYNVNITITFIKIYDVTIAPTSNGHVNVSHVKQVAGAIVTINAAPATKKYKTTSIQVVNATTSQIVPLTGIGNERSFIMPAFSVKVIASFGLVGSGGGGGGDSFGGVPKTGSNKTMIISSTDPFMFAGKRRIQVKDNNYAWQEEEGTGMWKIHYASNTGGDLVYIDSFVDIIKKEILDSPEGLKEVTLISTYLVDIYGNMLTEWYRSPDNKWLYFDPCMGLDQGKMCVNKWMQIDGKWYYFGNDGYLLTNCRTPDNYYVNENGEWQQDIPQMVVPIIQ